MALNVTPTRDPELGVMRQVRVDAFSWEDLDACPVCERSEHLRDLAVVEADTPGAVVAVCLDCLHFFKRRRPTGRWLSDYYAQDWDAPGQVRATAKRVSPRTKVLDFCEEHLPRRARVLDMGAGFGKDVLAFREAGHEAHALEASEHRAEYVRTVLGIPCATALFETAELPDGLDLIFSNHVLEHITDPAVVIARAADALGEGGLLFSALPNCLSYEHAVQFTHYAPHQSGFSLRSFSRLLEAHGFRVVKARATRELKVLAMRSNGATAGAFGSALPRTQAVGAVEDWMADGFGRAEGRRTLLWWRGGGKTRCYRGAMIPGDRRAYRALQAVRSGYPRLPRRLRRRSDRLVPDYLYRPEVRMLHVEASGSFELPVTVRYEASQPPIWVK